MSQVACAAAIRIWYLAGMSLRPPRPSRLSRAALRSWTSCSPGGTAMLGYSVAKGHDSGSVVMASDLVGRTGFEPVTSSVSGKRAPAAPTARDVRYAGYDGQLCASRRDYQKFAAHAD